jgi:hypothetical protein
MTSRAKLGDLTGDTFDEQDVAKALETVIGAMWTGQISTEDGERIAEALGVLRQSSKATDLDDIERRLAALEEAVSG